jgi:hypothetical protein
MEMGVRWYNPKTGRWVSADTVVPDPANPQSLNRFAYVLNSPAVWRDPSGYGPVYFDPGNAAGDYRYGKHRLEDYGVTEYDTGEGLAHAFFEGYNPFLDPGYLSAEIRMNHPVFADYYHVALANDLWLPLAEQDRWNWTKYWATVSGRTPHIGALASDPVLLTTVGMSILGTVRAGEGGSTTQLIWSGKAHNLTEGHWAAIEQKASGMLASGEYERIYVNRAISTATGRQIRDLRRPDLVGLKPDGSYHIVEVVSLRSQTEAMMLAKCQNMTAAFGGLTVTYEVIRPGGN